MTCRINVNSPSTQGSIGYTTNLDPSMTLGCGTPGGNIFSDNIGPLHLINIKRIAFKVREAAEAFTSPEGQAYFAGPGSQPVAAVAAAPAAAPTVAAAGASSAAPQRLPPLRPPARCSFLCRSTS